MTQFEAPTQYVVVHSTPTVCEFGRLGADRNIATLCECNATECKTGVDALGNRVCAALAPCDPTAEYVQVSTGPTNDRECSGASSESTNGDRCVDDVV